MTLTRRFEEIAHDPELMEMFLVHAQHLTQSALADLLNTTPVVLKKLAVAFQILLVPLGQEPKQKFIIDRLGKIPSDASIKVWRSGVIVKYTESKPGYLSTTHHFSNDARDTHDDNEYEDY